MNAAHLLSDHLLDQSNWRSLKAEEYPDDQRNERAADALSDAGYAVAEIPDDDPRLVKMDNAHWFDDGLCSPGEHGREVIRGYGFYHAGNVERLLDDLADAADQDAAEVLGMEIDDLLSDNGIDAAFDKLD